MTALEEARPELIEVGQAARDRVSELVMVRGGHCAGCGGTDFTVGRALYLGFLFLDEEHDAYLIALTCRNPSCPQPRAAIRLRYREFLG
ncbi:hypothetical protein [Mycobacterium sp. UM_Kg27]|uniref:hypothetical protein n=1 Tax=Mycobacterium sp. UM_Kg27 TaxID=1545693 RepID=UPI00061B0035|nr:hypothetical protein [Mycobacterium sp. UM_Kg27]